MIKVYNISVENHEGKRTRWRLKRTSENNIKTDLKEIDWDDVESIHLAPVNTVANLRDT
jgi:hypothetical protein